MRSGITEQGLVRRNIRGLHLDMSQMWSAIEWEQLHRSIGAMLHNRADAGRIDDIDVECVLHRCGQLRQRELLQQTQDLDIRPCAVAGIMGFESATQ